MWLIDGNYTFMLKSVQSEKDNDNYNSVTDDNYPELNTALYSILYNTHNIFYTMWIC